MLAKKTIKSLLIRITLSLILLITSIQILKTDQYYYKFHKILFNSNIDFSYINSKTDFLFNKIILDKERYVSSEEFRYNKVEKYNNGYLFNVDYNYVINNIRSGVVCFIGEKENLGNTIIIEGDDGTTIWYSNIENINVNLYDYVKEDIILGNSIEGIIILTFEDNEKYLSYEDYI